MIKMEVVSLTTTGTKKIFGTENTVPNGTPIWAIRYSGRYFTYAYLHEQSARTVCNTIFNMSSKCNALQQRHYFANHFHVSSPEGLIVSGLSPNEAV